MSALVDHRSDSGDGVSDVDLDVEPTVLVSKAADAAAPDAVPHQVYAHVEQDGPAASPAQLRVDFGAHLEANYQRLVAQLYAITLDPGEAHDVVQDAYSRAWRNWATISRTDDPTAWIRRVAVRSTVRSWRRVLNRFGIGRHAPVADGVDPRTAAMLAALGRLPAPERRCVVLFHMAGAPLAEIAAVEQVSPGTIQARLSRARHVVTEGLADVLPEVLGMPGEQPYEGDVYDEEGEYR
ncbi:RNA polymerase sigma factor [Pseudonocardia sp. GCM10023141]|uniref:RNA polymerase sigma factor n=1 Tax=Pseudonocardia sp. GCM10023141 TaxID=3252653 RepID=UPI0036154E1D